MLLATVVRTTDPLNGSDKPFAVYPELVEGHFYIEIVNIKQMTRHKADLFDMGNVVFGDKLRVFDGRFPHSAQDCPLCRTGKFTKKHRNTSTYLAFLGKIILTQSKQSKRIPRTKKKKYN